MAVCEPFSHSCICLLAEILNWQCTTGIIMTNFPDKLNTVTLALFLPNGYKKAMVESTKIPATTGSFITIYDDPSYITYTVGIERKITNSDCIILLSLFFYLRKMLSLQFTFQITISSFSHFPYWYVGISYRLNCILQYY